MAAKGDSVNVTVQAGLDVEGAVPAPTVLTAETKPSRLADTEATTFVADEAAQARMLEITRSPEAMAAASLATSVVEDSDEALPFSPIPAEAENGSLFLCPYRFHFQQLKCGISNIHWRCEEMNLPQGLADLLQAVCSPRS